MVKQHEWFKPKPYNHFDSKITDKEFDKVLRYIQVPENIKAHSFWPVISYDKTKHKTVEDEWGVRRYDTSGFRTISYAAHLDAHIFAFYSNSLGELYERQLIEKGMEKQIIAFRKIKKEDGSGKSNIDFAKDAFDTIKEMGECDVLACDITKFFDNLDREVLFRHWCRLLNVDRMPDDWFAIFKQVTNQRFVKLEDLSQLFGNKAVFNSMGRPICSASDFRSLVKPKVRSKNRGIPQGLPISALLANIYMVDVDEFMSRFVESLGGRYFRYCDDILMILPRGQTNFGNLENLIREKLDSVQLDLNSGKTERCEFRFVDGRLRCAGKPLQYLGFTFDGETSLLRVGSMSSFRSKLRSQMRRTRGVAWSHNSKKLAKGEAATPVFTKSLFRKFTHIGSRNFITYGLRAAEIMNSEGIRIQIKKQNKWAEEEIRSLKKLYGEKYRDFHANIKLKSDRYETRNPKDELGV